MNSFHFKPIPDKRLDILNSFSKIIDKLDEDVANSERTLCNLLDEEYGFDDMDNIALGLGHEISGAAKSEWVINVHHKAESWKKKVIEKWRKTNPGKSS